MLNDYNLLKFVVSFLFIIFLIYGIYLFLLRYGNKLNISPKGAIKIKDIKFFSKDKGLILVEIKDEEILFSFDNINGIKLVKKWQKESFNEKNSFS